MDAGGKAGRRWWSGRRIARLVGGFTLLAIGALLLVLPGPGIPLLLAGLALLATELHWARRLQGRVSAVWARARARARLDRPGGDPARP